MFGITINTANLWNFFRASFNWIVCGCLMAEYRTLTSCFLHGSLPKLGVKLHSFIWKYNLSSENNSNETQQLRFILRKYFYFTCFGWQSHPSSGVHVLYMATGKQAHCKLTRAADITIFWAQQSTLYIVVEAHSILTRAAIITISWA